VTLCTNSGIKTETMECLEIGGVIFSNDLVGVSVLGYSIDILI